MIKILKNSISNLKNVSRSFGSQSTGTFEKLVNHKSNLELKLKDSNNEEKSLKFNPHWLRFNCILCKDQSSGQRTIRSESIPIDLSIKDVKIFENNVIIKWNDESNQQDSQLPLSFLMNHHPSETPHEARFKPCREIGFLDYSKFYDSNNERNYSEIIKWYQQMADYGVAVLRNCGTKENTVRGIAELIAPVQRTLYGEEFDVRVEKNITNIALLDGPLPLHMDLPYYETPPGLQFLHCISFDKEIVGGESLLLDSYATLEEFRVKYPEYFYNLTKIPASWQYLIVGAQKQEVMMMSQPHIRLNHLDQIIGFRWSQDQEGPLKNLSEEKIKLYYESYLTLARFISESKNLIEYRLQPGELLVFNNRRFLHGRNGFSSMKGKRHFQGVYINLDDFLSEYRAQIVKANLIANNPEENKFFVDLSEIKVKSVTTGNCDYA